MVELSEHYIVTKFYQFAGLPKYNKSQQSYQGCCPICREGKSWLVKRRLYYKPKINLFMCHNCGWSSRPYRWIRTVTGMTHAEIKNDITAYDTIDINVIDDQVEHIESSPSLPGDCINLSDELQVRYYKDNKHVVAALAYLKKRRLLTAINKPTAFYFCKDDPTHENRIVIPYFDTQGKIVFYQSRTIKNSPDEIRYLSKLYGVRSIFNLDKVNTSQSEVFIFEGPFNSCFIRNGVAVGGIQENSSILFSEYQEKQINLMFKFMRKVWVLDSQWIDTASRTKTRKLLEEGQEVFLWPKNIGIKYKDINDVCCALNLDSISSKFVLDNTFSGAEGMLRLSNIK